MNANSYESTLKIEQQDEEDLSVQSLPLPKSKSSVTIMIIGLTIFIFSVASIAVSLNSKSTSGMEKTIQLQHQPPTRSSYSILAPVEFSHSEDKTSLTRMREKYGFSETGIYVERDVNKESTSVGWAWAYLYEGETCSGDDLAVGGFATGTCVPIDADTNDPQSWFIDCDSEGNVYWSIYNGTDCNVTLYTELVATTGCQIFNWTDSQFTTDPTSYSIKVSCSTGTALPLHSAYNVYMSYMNTPEATCDSGLQCFEAVPLGTCLPFEHTIHSDTGGRRATTFDSVIFGESDDSPFMTYYTDSSNCTGVAVEEALSTNCTYDTIHPEASSKWEYYSPRKTSSPTLSPTKAKRSDN